MTMLTNDLERRFQRPERQQHARSDAAGTHLAMIRRVCLSVLTVLLAGGALAAVIALKTALVFWRFKLGAG